MSLETVPFWISVVRAGGGGGGRGNSAVCAVGVV